MAHGIQDKLQTSVPQHLDPVTVWKPTFTQEHPILESKFESFRKAETNLLSVKEEHD